MQCPMCGGAHLVHERRDVLYTYKGRQTVLPAIEADWCSTCGEALFAPGEGDRYGTAVKAFQREVNAGRVTPAEITRVREKLHLNQQQAATLFGGGVNAFSRYETGKTKPPVALVKLFQLLDRHPELLDEIRTA